MNRYQATRTMRRAALPLAVFASILGLSTLQASAYTGQELASRAKIDINAARAAALKAHPGKVVAEELEAEAGGSGLRYSFDIKTAAGTQEVGVDAASGTVLENAKEGPNPD